MLFTGCGSMVVMKSGSVVSLKQERQLNLEYVYDGMLVGKKLTEQAYVEKRVAEKNAKEAGSGDTWRQAWVNDRAGRYQPKFESLVNKMLAEGPSGLAVGKYPEAKYTLILKTTYTEPGYNVAIARHPAWISADAIIVETKNRGNQLALITITRAPGQDAWGFDFDAGYRLQESYAKAGKELGIFLRKRMK
jgi:hypothetical protein